MPFNIAPTRRYVVQELVQCYPLFLLYPRIECILQGLLLLLCTGGAEKVKVT